jgi:hypothetical protein
MRAAGSPAAALTGQIGMRKIPNAGRRPAYPYLAVMRVERAA